MNTHQQRWNVVEILHVADRGLHDPDRKQRLDVRMHTTEPFAPHPDEQSNDRDQSEHHRDAVNPRDGFDSDVQPRRLLITRMWTRTRDHRSGDDRQGSEDTDRTNERGLTLR